jgi:hypothetical protein
MRTIRIGGSQKCFWWAVAMNEIPKLAAVVGPNLLACKGISKEWKIE